MPAEMTPLNPAIGTLPTYVVAGELASVLAMIPADQCSRLRNAASGDAQAALAIATARIDSLPWQGQRAVEGQPLAFPRFDPISGSKWEVNETGTAYKVPTLVQMAACYEADMILDKDRNGRLQRIADGLAAQSVGSISESYRAVSGVRKISLTEQAEACMMKFRLRTGTLR